MPLLWIASFWLFTKCFNLNIWKVWYCLNIGTMNIKYTFFCLTGTMCWWDTWLCQMTSRGGVNSCCSSMTTTVLIGSWERPKWATSYSHDVHFEIYWNTSCLKLNITTIQCWRKCFFVCACWHVVIKDSMHIVATKDNMKCNSRCICNVIYFLVKLNIQQEIM